MRAAGGASEDRVAERPDLREETLPGEAAKREEGVDEIDRPARLPAYPESVIELDGGDYPLPDQSLAELLRRRCHAPASSHASSESGAMTLPGILYAERGRYNSVQTGAGRHFPAAFAFFSSQKIPPRTWL